MKFLENRKHVDVSNAEEHEQEVSRVSQMCLRNTALVDLVHEGDLDYQASRNKVTWDWITGIFNHADKVF